MATRYFAVDFRPAVSIAMNYHGESLLVIFSISPASLGKFREWESPFESLTTFFDAPKCLQRRLPIQTARLSSKFLTGRCDQRPLSEAKILWAHNEHWKVVDHSKVLSPLWRVLLEREKTKIRHRFVSLLLSLPVRPSFWAKTFGEFNLNHLTLKRCIKVASW